jgi:hypothetical protein
MNKNDLVSEDFLLTNIPQIAKNASCGGLKRNLPGLNRSGVISLLNKSPVNRIKKFLVKKSCSVLGCKKEYYAKGYCRNHWAKFLWYPKIKERHHQYQKEYRLKKYGIGNKIHKCKIRDCQNRTIAKYHYCYPHRVRIASHLSLDLSINFKHSHPNFKGKNNPMWRGGVAEYPNHYLMKKNRLIILLHHPKCEICSKLATQVHHKNSDKSDHRLSNLMAVCHKCHPRPKTHITKYNKLYGMNLTRIAKLTNYNTARIWQWHKKGILSGIIASNPKIFNYGG